MHYLGLMSSTQTPPLWKALVGVCICAVLWGSAFPAIKSIYAEWSHIGIEITPSCRFWLAGIRFSIAGGFLLALSKLTQKSKTASTSLWQQIKNTPKAPLIFMALCQTFLQYTLFYTALVYGSGSLNSLMTASGSFWWLILAPLFGKAVWGGWKVWAILFLGAIAVGTAVYAPQDSSTNAALSIAIMLCANLCGTLAVLFFGKIKPTMYTPTATGISLFMGGLGLCLIGTPVFKQTAQLFTPHVITMTLYLALVSATAFTIWNELSTRYPVSLLATYRFLIPISGVLLSINFIPEEQLNLMTLIGTSIVAIAMTLATKLNKS